MKHKFEWDKTKAMRNQAKHGVGFELAKQVFNDAFAIEFLDDRRDYGEERRILIGKAKDVILFVVYTERHEVIRIISARRAAKHEQEAYFG